VLFGQRVAWDGVMLSQHYMLEELAFSVGCNCTVLFICLGVRLVWFSSRSGIGKNLFYARTFPFPSLIMKIAYVKMRA
jgi:uncharacterized membrane protein